MPVGCNQFSFLQAVMFCQGSADVAVSASTSTTVMTIGGTNGAVQAYGNDTWSPNLDITLAILLGATPPTVLTIDYGLVLGTAIDFYSPPAAQLVASATILVGLTLIGPASKATWQASVIPLVYVFANQAITVKAVGSRGVFSLYMGGP